MADNPADVNTLMASRGVNYLVGQVMKASRGKANPLVTKHIIVRELITRWYTEAMEQTNPPDLGVHVSDEVQVDESFC